MNHGRLVVHPPTKIGEEMAKSMPAYLLCDAGLDSIRMILQVPLEEGERLVPVGDGILYLGINLSIRSIKAIGLKDGVPPEIGGTTCRHDSALHV